MADARDGPSGEARTVKTLRVLSCAPSETRDGSAGRELAGALGHLHFLFLLMMATAIPANDGSAGPVRPHRTAIVLLEVEIRLASPTTSRGTARCSCATVLRL